jgi:hypothetical protein
MKQFRFFLLLLVIIFCSASRQPKQTDTRIRDSNGLLLVYTGNISSKYINLDVAIRCEMDPSVGVYDTK